MTAYVRVVKSSSVLYLDHHTASPLRPGIAALMHRVGQMGGNASSVHQLGRRARRVLHHARTQLLALSGANAAHSEVVFCASLAETRALSIWGVAWAQRQALGRRAVVLDAALWTRCPGLIGQLRLAGFVLRQWQPKATGGDASSRRLTLGPGPLAHELAPIAPDDVAVLAVTALGLEGQTPSWPTLAGWAKQHQARLIVDAGTAAGRLPLEADGWQATAMCLDSAALGGPPGIAALVLRKGTSLQPLWAGGGQNFGHRSGTEAPILAAGMGEAASLARQMQSAEAKRLGLLRAALGANAAPLILPTECPELVLWPRPAHLVTRCVGLFDAGGVMVGWTPGGPGSTQAYVCLTLGWTTTAEVVHSARAVLHQVLAASKDDGCVL